MASLLYWEVAMQAHVSACMISMILQEVAMAVAAAMAVKAALKVHIPSCVRAFRLGAHNALPGTFTAEALSVRHASVPGRGALWHK